MTVQIKRYVATPQTPNFIRFSDGDQGVCVGELSDEEIMKIGEAWTKELLIKAQNKRNQSKVGKSDD